MLGGKRMAMIKCPGCGQEVSEKAKKCPNCGHRFAKKIPKKIIVILAVIAICILTIVSIVAVVKQNEKKKQEEIQAQIQTCLDNIQQYYASGEFAKIFDELNELDRLGYDTKKQREIAEYDQKVYYTAKKFYDTLKSVDNKLHNGSFASLRNLMDELKTPMSEMDAVEINKDSKLGCYIQSVINDTMYDGLRDTYVNGHTYDDVLDGWLTQDVYKTAIEIYTETLVRHNFPYGG